jgi:hypothetical protein
MLRPRIRVLSNPWIRAVHLACAVTLLAGCRSSKPPQQSDRGPSSSSSPSTTAQTQPPVDLNQALQQMGLKESADVGSSGDSSGARAALPHFPPVSAGTTAANQITLQPGMTMVESVYDKLIGDYEVVISVDAVAEDAVHLTISSEGPDTPSGSDPSPPSTLKVTSTRSVSQQDSLHAEAMLGQARAEIAMRCHSTFEAHSSSAFFQERCAATERTANFERVAKAAARCASFPSVS